jgi:nucleoside-diphosphate-sugar epimerase
MKVLVTGGAGSVGRWVVRHLAQKGHEVTVGARTPGVEPAGATYRVLDITQYDKVVEACTGMDAVVHLSAIPNPRGGHSCAIFRTNCLGTYHIYEACAAVGVHKLAVASSINALGQHFGVKPLPVRYFPIDEDHPQLCSDPYSFSKHVTEEIGRYFWEKDGLSSVCIRIPAVWPPSNEMAGRLRWMRENRPLGMQRDYWVYIDARDSALVFTAGIEVEYDGPHTIFANDRWNALGLPSRQLAAKCYPEVVDWRAPVEADEALVSCRKAKELLGWEPSYSWRGVAEGGPLP